MTLNDWSAAAKQDAERRGIPQLPPLIDTLRIAMERLRAADWNDDMRARNTDSDETRPAAERPRG